jgi:hypothetical protein
MRKPEKEKLNPCREHGEQHQHNSSNQERGPNPDAKAAIWRIMNGGVRRIKRDHRRSPGALSCIFGIGATAVRLAAVVTTKKWRIGQRSG